MQKLISKFRCLEIITFSLIIPSYGYNLSQTQLNQIFNHYSACFILFNLNNHKNVLEYNKGDYCNEAISPNVTFEIPLSLMAFDQRRINESTIFVWENKTWSNPHWNHDQTPITWQKYSVIWVSQQITKQLGLSKIKYYLTGFKYGNRDFSGDHDQHNGLTNAWLNSSLKISAFNQLQFLHAMLEYQLPVSKLAIQNTSQNIYLGNFNNDIDLYGKTASGWHVSNISLDKQIKLNDGWFIGYLKDKDQTYIFVTNISYQNNLNSSINFDSSGNIAKKLTMQILNNYFK